MNMANAGLTWPYGGGKATQVARIQYGALDLTYWRNEEGALAACETKGESSVWYQVRSVARDAQRRIAAVEAEKKP